MAQTWEQFFVEHWLALLQAFKDELGDEELFGQQSAEFIDPLKPVDTQKLARYLVTPQGRARLVYHTAVRDPDLLKVAFAAELLQLSISEEQAVRLVSDGVTLRDMKSKPPGELARLGQDLFGFDQGYDESPGFEELDDEDMPAQESPTSETLREQWFAERKVELEDAETDGRNLFHIDFYDLLVVSDFHLAAGNHPLPEGLARFSPTEDFYFDDAVFRFLFHAEMERRERDGYPYELVFNGDMVDFAQVVVQTTAEPDPWELEIALPTELQEWPSLFDKEREESYLNAAPLRGKLWDILDEVWGDDGDRDSGDRTPWRRIKDELERADDPDKYADEQKGAVRDRLAEGQPKVLAMSRTEALGQLASVYRGHPRFFQAVSWFLAQGNRLVLMRGNHDPQWYWPEVQLAFVGWLKEAYESLAKECDDASAQFTLPLPPGEVSKLKKNLPPMDLMEFRARVDFDHSWYYYRERLAYIEHGGQQEAVDSHRHFLLPVYPPPKHREQRGTSPVLAPLPPKEASDWLPVLAVQPDEQELDPPIGSLGQVFFVNNMEIEMPNFDLPDYVQKVYLPWLLYHRPLVLLVGLRRAAGRWCKAFTDWWKRHSQKGLEALHEKRLEAYARLTGIEKDCVSELDRTRWVKNWRNHLLVQTVLARVLPVVLAVLAAFGYLVWRFSLKELKGLVEEHIPPPWIQTLVVGGVFYWVGTLVRRWVGLGEDYLFEPSKRVARILKKYGRDVPFILFGHDHVRNAQPVDLGKQCASCGTLWGKWRFLPKRWSDKFQPWKWRQFVRFEKGYVDGPKFDCPECGKALDGGALWHELHQGLPLTQMEMPDKSILFICDKCFTHGDLGHMPTSCPRCKQPLPSEQIDAILEEAAMHSGGVVAFSCPHCDAPGDSWRISMSCPQCSKPLPRNLIDKVCRESKVIPHSVILACPDCGTIEPPEWLCTWHLSCPNCGKTPSKRDLCLNEVRSFLRCDCGTHYPAPPPVERWYLNTGTWMYKYEMARKRLVREPLEYSFVQMINTHRVLAAKEYNHLYVYPTVKLLRWNDAVGKTEPCETFMGIDEQHLFSVR